MNYQQFLAAVEQGNPDGDIIVVTDILSSHNSLSTRTWLAGQSFASPAEIETATSRATA